MQACMLAIFSQKPRIKSGSVCKSLQNDNTASMQRLMVLDTCQPSCPVHCSFKIVAVPADAKKNGVRIRWWQPHHDGLSNGDWAIDTILIAGKATNPEEMRDGFDDQIRRYMWFEDNNAKLGSFCGSAFTISGEAETDEDVTLTTADLLIKHDYILQFSISVGCHVSVDTDIAPVHLQYSIDYGMTWHYLVQECLSFYPQCNGEMTVPSLYFSSSRWRRETLILKGTVVSR